MKIGWINYGITKIYSKIIKQQNEAIRKAQDIRCEILNWCEKSGIDTWSKEYKQANGSLSEAVAPIDEEILLQLYKNANKI